MIKSAATAREIIALIHHLSPAKRREIMLKARSVGFDNVHIKNKPASTSIIESELAPTSVIKKEAPTSVREWPNPFDRLLLNIDKNAPFDPTKPYAEHFRFNYPIVK